MNVLHHFPQSRNKYSTLVDIHLYASLREGRCGQVFLGGGEGVSIVSIVSVESVDSVVSVVSIVSIVSVLSVVSVVSVVSGVTDCLQEA